MVFRLVNGLSVLGSQVKPSLLPVFVEKNLIRTQPCLGLGTACVGLPRGFSQQWANGFVYVTLYGCFHTAMVEVFVTEIARPAMLKIFTIWTLTGKFADTLSRRPQMASLACLGPWLRGWKRGLIMTCLPTVGTLRASPRGLASVVTQGRVTSYEHSGLQLRGRQQTGNGSRQSPKTWTQNMQDHFHRVLLVTVSQSLLRFKGRGQRPKLLQAGVSKDLRPFLPHRVC